MNVEMKNKQEYIPIDVDKKEIETFKNIGYKIKKDWQLYLLILPMLLWFLLFIYKPMGGLLIAFKNYETTQGIAGSGFNGLSNFFRLVSGTEALTFWRAFRNTFIISIYGLIFGFPIPIILALLFSEINNKWYLKITQTISYLPHFLSEVTITSIVIILLYKDDVTTGILARLLYSLGIAQTGENIRLMAQYFRPMYIITGIWKESGYSSIVYFAAIMGISPVLYEALKVDGGNKWQEIRYVTFPGMAPTLIIMIILRIGRMLSVGYERVILLYTSSTYETGDVLSSFIYRIGLNNASGSDIFKAISGAADMFNSIIGFVLVIGANFISSKISKTSLW